jgi:hypothetical protein
MSGVNGVGGLSGVAAYEGDDGVEVAHAPHDTALLPDPVAEIAFSGDPGAMVAALVVKSAKGERDVARQTQDAEERIQDREEEEQVQAMHDKASMLREQAIASGVCEMASGAASLTAATYSPQSREARGWEAGGRLAKAYGDITDNLGRAAAADQDATIAAHEHAAGHARRAVDEATDDVKDARKLLETAIEFYREYSSAQDQAKAAAIHRS